MAVLLFSLRGVSEDEALEVRELLNQNAIDFYETSAGNWGISMPALWLKNDQELEKASTLLATYQQQRQLLQREKYRQLKQAGRQQTVFGVFRQRPLQFIAYLALIGMVLYFSVKLVLDMGQ